MQEIKKIVDAKVQSMVDDNTLQEAIEQSVEKAILKAVNNQFESYGAITKQIEKAIQDGLKINLKDLPFETYNEQMLVAVKARLGGLFQGAASERFMAEMDKVLAPAPAEMSINDFVEAVVEIWKTDEWWDADELDEQATVEFEECDAVRGSYTLRLWKQRESSFGSRLHGSRDKEPDLILHITSDGRIRISHRQHYNLTCFSEHQALVFKLYAAGTVLTGLDEFDPFDCELTLKEIDS